MPLHTVSIYSHFIVIKDHENGSIILGGRNYTDAAFMFNPLALAVSTFYPMDIGFCKFRFPRKMDPCKLSKKLLTRFTINA